MTGFLLPPSIDEWLPQRHLARFVVEVIDTLDLSAMSKAYRGTGAASYHPAPLLGRSIAYERLVGSQLIQEDEPLPSYDQNIPPPPPPMMNLRAHPKAPYLRLVVSHERPALLNFGSGDMLQKMFGLIERWRAANSEDYSHTV